MSASQPIIIKDFHRGMAPSPHLGPAVFRNADIESWPGAIKTGKKATSRFATNFSTTFTADATTDILTLGQTLNLTTGRAINVSTSGGVLPAPLVAGTNYFVIANGSNTIKLATTIANANAGTAIDITTNGTPTLNIASVNPGIVQSIVQDPRTGMNFSQDSNGRVWYDTGGVNLLLNGNTLTGSGGNGLCIFGTSDGNATYLFVFRNAVIDVINVFGSANIETPVWTSAWQTMNSGAGSGASHYAIIGQDNIIYFCDSRYVGSILEKAGSIFDPANAATYTYNSQALALPQREISQWLEELGITLLTAGSTFNKVYPWDRSAASYTLPLIIPEKGVMGLKNIGNTVYIIAGLKGNIYSTQGTYVRFFQKIPESITNPSAGLYSNILTWGGIASKNGSLLVGVGFTLPSGSGGAFLIYPDGRVVQDNTPSAGSKKPTFIFGSDDAYYMGYDSGEDIIDATTRYSSFDTVFQSDLFRVGTKTQQAAFSQLEIQTARPSSTGHMRVKYRTDDISSFADFPGGTVSYTANGTDASFQTDIGLINIENLQVQLEMDGDFEVLEIRLLP